MLFWRIFFFFYFSSSD